MMKLLLKYLLFLLLSLLHISYSQAQTLVHVRNTIPYSEFNARLKEYVDNNPEKAHKGIIDVTASPYNAKGDGSTDDTQALQNAIDDAYEFNFVTFLPADKIFILSDQLELVSVLESRKFCHKFVGSSNGNKPILRLKNGSTVKDNILVYFRLNSPNKGDAPASHYGAIFRNIHIDMGNNPEVTALSMAGAQHCAIEDIKIYGEDFNTGILNLPGSGGATVNVHVVGGNIGIHQNQYRDNPTIEGLVLEGQKEYGIKHEITRGPLIISGFKITGPSEGASGYQGIFLDKKWGNVSPSGALVHGVTDLCLTDGSIEVFGAEDVGISNGSQDLTLVNVYFKAPIMVENGVTTEPYSSVEGSLTQWKKVSRLLFTSAIDMASVVAEGLPINDRIANYEYVGEIVDESPSEELYMKHSYDAADIPDFDSPNLLDISVFGATPFTENSDDDDGIAIQKALDEVVDPQSEHYGKTVFVPRGYFDITTPLIVRKGTKLIGAAMNISSIQPKEVWDNGLGAIITTEDTPDGNIVLSDFGILGFLRMTYLRVQSGNTIVRDLSTEDQYRYFNNGEISAPTLKRKNEQDEPYIDFCNNAGGKVYHLSLDHIHIKDRGALATPSPGYYLVRVKDTHHPLDMYQVSAEFNPNSPQVMVENVSNFSMYGFKYEGETQLLNIENSDHVKIVGGAGNYDLIQEHDQGMVVIKDSYDVTLRNLTRASKKEEDLNKPWVVEDDVDKASGLYSLLWYENDKVRPEPKEPLSSANDEIADIKVYAYQNQIKIDCQEPTTTRVFDLIGQLVVQSNDKKISIHRKGLYIVVVERQNHLPYAKKVFLHQ